MRELAATEASSHEARAGAKRFFFLRRRTRTSESPARVARSFAHLHICTFAHLHICTFAHLRARIRAAPGEPRRSPLGWGCGHGRGE
eukprot:1184151-Prorocentrum_minimum.AAC.6